MTPPPQQPVVPEDDTARDAPDVFFARQPIFDRRGEVAGYELLYRAEVQATSAEGSVAWMSQRVLVDAVLGIGLDVVTGGHPAYINIPQDLLVGGAADLLDPGAVIIEVLESVPPDPGVIDACKRLAAAGYRIALDDYVEGDLREPLLAHAHIIKVDVLRVAADRLLPLVGRLRSHEAKLLAEKVEDAAMWDRCMTLGFDLFQGYFFRHPQLVTQRDLTAEHLKVLELFNLLSDPGASDARIIEAFRGDVALSFKLLAMANSAAVGATGVESIPHALRLLGRGTIARWMVLLLAASAGRRSGTKAELLRETLVRARLCERIAESGSLARSAGSLFLVGLLSHFDALLNTPLEPIIQRLNVSAPIRAAVLERTGEFATPLLAVEAYHDGRWEEAERAATQLHVDPGRLPMLYRDAIEWVEQQLQVLRAA